MNFVPSVYDAHLNCPENRPSVVRQFTKNGVVRVVSIVIGTRTIPADFAETAFCGALAVPHLESVE